MLCLVSRIAVHLKALNLSKLVRTSFGRFQEFHISRHIFQMLQLEPRCNCLWHDTRLQPQSLHHSFKRRRDRETLGNLAVRHSVVAYLAFVLADSSNELFICDLSYTSTVVLMLSSRTRGPSAPEAAQRLLATWPWLSNGRVALEISSWANEHWVWRCLFTIFAGTEFKHLAYNNYKEGHRL